MIFRCLLVHFNQMSAWCCSYCGLMNPESIIECIACFEYNNKKFWQCPSCDILNKSLATKCVACYTIKKLPKRNHGRWEKLASLPWSIYSHHVFINDNEMIVIPYKYYSDNGDGVYKYNCIQNEWSKIINYPDDHDFMIFPTAVTFDKQNNCVYVSSNCQENVIRVDLNRFQLEELSDSKLRHDDNSDLLCIDDELHEIGGGIAGLRHSAWNTDKLSKKVSEVVNFEISDGKLDDPTVVYLEYTNSILLFATFDRGENAVDYICEYSMTGREWERINVSLPAEFDSGYGYFCNMGTIVVENGRYAIIFGGDGSNIHIYDTKCKVFLKSGMTKPKGVGGSCRVAVTTDKHYDEKVVFGFIHSNYIGLQAFPKELIHLVANLYSGNKWVYLMERNYGNLWRINVNEIL